MNLNGLDEFDSFKGQDQVGRDIWASGKIDGDKYRREAEEYRGQ